MRDHPHGPFTDRLGFNVCGVACAAVLPLLGALVGYTPSAAADTKVWRTE
jgi:hypothetical protein